MWPDYNGGIPSSLVREAKIFEPSPYICVLGNVAPTFPIPLPWFCCCSRIISRRQKDPWATPSKNPWNWKVIGKVIHSELIPWKNKIVELKKSLSGNQLHAYPQRAKLRSQPPLKKSSCHEPWCHSLRRLGWQLSSKFIYNGYLLIKVYLLVFFLMLLRLKIVSYISYYSAYFSGWIISAKNIPLGSSPTFLPGGISVLKYTSLTASVFSLSAVLDYTDLHCLLLLHLLSQMTINSKHIFLCNCSAEFL